MSTETSKALVRRAMEEGFNAGDLEVMDELFLPTYTRHEVGGRGVASLAEHKAGLAALRHAIPDARFTIADLVGDGDRVAVRFTLTGTRGGPSGRPVQRQLAAFFRIQDGKIAEGWVVGTEGSPSSAA